MKIKVKGDLLQIIEIENKNLKIKVKVVLLQIIEIEICFKLKI